MEQNISTLNLPKTTIKKLNNLGKNYCCQLTESFLNSQSITLPKPPPTRTALVILEEELLNGCILSFNAELDQVLSDEIVSKRITELAGLPGTGKTQICFQLCVTVQLPRSAGGLEGEVVFINTNKNFASHRLKELCRNITQQFNSQNFTEETILKHIYVFTCNSMLELSAAVFHLETILNNKMVKLLIIDSISNPLREIDPKKRTTSIYKLFGDLQSLATKFNFAIVVTNDFTTRIKNDEAYHTPSFRESFFERINSRICLSKNNDIYCAELVKGVNKTPRKWETFEFLRSRVNETLQQQSGIYYTVIGSKRPECILCIIALSLKQSLCLYFYLTIIEIKHT